ncbi:hypothetical protein HDU91_002086 [Kappamyces sp. JEL0680]|nr:hypothetical protein HDU91_002086 [Kappamyces sp. JEL0680]
MIITPAAVLACTNQLYSQCGGQNWTGPTCCPEGSVCQVSNAYYSQCVPASTPSTTDGGSTTPKPTTVPSGSGAIRFGSATPNYNPPFPISVDGKSISTSLTIDANWRWVHNKDGYTNCYSDKSWNPTYCPDPATCAASCLLEGVSKDQYVGTYGVHTQGNAVTLDLVTNSNVGSRLFLLDNSDANAYYGFNLLNRELSFTVDVSKLGCGLNGALYFVSMDTKNPNPDPQAAGPAYGVGYGDAQCPNDIKYVGGVPNTDGSKRVCSAEMDIWEANAISTGDVDCGLGASRYQGQCDKDGADYNPYRNGILDFYGKGLKVDTSAPMTVVTQFLTSDNTDSGELVSIKRYYRQNGQTIPGGEVTDSLTASRKAAFNETNYFATLGGMKAMGESFRRKMVLVLSVWGDTEFNMEWLDSRFPTGSTQKGAARGPCEHGTYDQTISQSRSASVTFSDIQVQALFG